MPAMTRPDPHWGLYLITDETMLAAGSLVPFLRDALRVGIRIVQFRSKSAPSETLRSIGREIRLLTREHDATLIVNDRIDLATELEADGLHLGKTDASPEEARRILGPSAIIGLSTHNREQIEDAKNRPVDYIGVGPVFATSTKSDPDPIVGTDLITWAHANSSLPFVAIGGIDLENLGQVLRAGARNVAVISAIARSTDPIGAVREFIRRIDSFTVK